MCVQMSEDAGRCRLSLYLGRGEQTRQAGLGLGLEGAEGTAHGGTARKGVLPAIGHVLGVLFKQSLELRVASGAAVDNCALHSEHVERTTRALSPDVEAGRGTAWRVIMLASSPLVSVRVAKAAAPPLFLGLADFDFWVLSVQAW